MLLEACGGDLMGLRDAALLSLGYDAGLRVSELAAVTLDHIDPQEDGSGVLERRLITYCTRCERR